MYLKSEAQTYQQYFCAFTVSLGALFIGTNVAWTSPCLKFLLSENYTTPSFVIEIEEGNLIAALTPLGAIFGSIPAGFLADLLGRRLTLIQITTLQISASILATFATNVTSLYIARFVSGLVMGAYCVLIPMYINEIAEKSIRGNLVSFFELLISVGILYAYVLGLFDSYLILSHSITAAMVLYLLSLILIPETPIYFLMKNRKMKAEKSLKKLRGSYYNVDDELKEMETQLEDFGKQRLSYAILSRKANVKGLSYGIIMMIFQQLSGIEAVIYFGETIFETAETSSPTLCTVILGIVQILGTFASGIVVDRIGRKILLFLSCILMTSCLTSIGLYFWLQERKTDVSVINWLPLVSLVIFILGYSIGFGPISWLILGELLGIEIKRFGLGIATAASFLCQTFTTFSFHSLVRLTSPSITFWTRALTCSSALIFIAILPETKNKSLQQIQDELAGKALTDETDTSPT